MTACLLRVGRWRLGSTGLGAAGLRRVLQHWTPLAVFRFRKRPDVDATLEDMVERLAGIPLLGQRSSAWHYGINMEVLGGLTSTPVTTFDIE